MANKIWIFGDSFSADLMDKGVIGWTIPYIKWKGYVPKTFPKILSKELNLPIMNLAQGGIGNDTIFETIYNNIQHIQKNDVIIIGWSSIARFRYTVKNKDKWYNVVPNCHLLGKDEMDSISQNTIDEILINRTHTLYKKESEDRVNFINWLFKDMKIVQWSSVNDISNVLYASNEYEIERINIETKNVINDPHYSENGNIKLSEILLNELFKNEK